MKIEAVPPEHVDRVWVEILPQVERGLRYGAGDSLDPEDLRVGILRGDLILWAIHEGGEIIAAIVLRVSQETPARRVVVVVLAAGRDFDRWVSDVVSLLREFKELCGAQAIQSLARPGMAKWLADAGWHRKATLMEIE